MQVIKKTLKFTLKATRLGRLSCSCHSAVTFGRSEVVMGSSGERPGPSKGQNDGGHGALGNLQWSRALFRCVPQSNPLSHYFDLKASLFTVFLLRYGAVRAHIGVGLSQWRPVILTPSGCRNISGMSNERVPKKVQWSAQTLSTSDNGTNLCFKKKKNLIWYIFKNV